MEERSDAGLLEAARRGDAKSLETLLERHQEQVYRFGMKMCRDPEDAQDVLQDTLLAMARNVRDFRGASSLSTWLYSIARSFCIKKRRRSVFAPEVVSLESGTSAALAVRDQGRDPERTLADREVGAALEAAIASLEPEYREVLLLRDVEGLSATEVAEVTSLSVSAVKSRLHRARASVRERLAPLLAPLPAQPSKDGGVCPDVVDFLSRHLEGDIGRDACAEMERHVAACSSCHSACESLRQTLRLCESAPAPAVPESLQQSIRRGIRDVLAERRA